MMHGQQNVKTMTNVWETEGEEWTVCFHLKYSHESKIDLRRNNEQIESER
jgi:hypothetical protein